MEKTTKRMIISVLTLVLTVAALGTTTFAWFSLSTTSRISNISGQVTGGEGLEVKLVRDGGTSSAWLANIDANTLANFYPQNFRFEAVTTDDPNATEFFMMKQSDEGFITLDGATQKNMHYLEFDIQLRSQTPGIVRLTGLEFPDATNPPVDLVIDGNAYEQFDNLEEKTNYTVRTRAKNAARVSISQLDKEGNQLATQVYQNGDETPTHGADGGLRYDGSNIIGNHVMGTTGVNFGQWSYLTQSRGLKIYSDISDLANPVLLNDPTGITILAAETSVNIDALTYRTTINLLEGGVGGTGYYSASFRVRIWIEGWDADSYDSIYNALLSVNFTFQKPNLTNLDLLNYSKELLTPILASFGYTAGNNALPETVANLPITYQIDQSGTYSNLESPYTLPAGTYNLKAIITGENNVGELATVEVIQAINLP